MSKEKYFKMQNSVESFMDANYPCACPPDDPECDRNVSESGFITELVAEHVQKTLAELPKGSSAEDATRALAELFLWEDRV
jgi:hypothetical protein